MNRSESETQLAVASPDGDAVRELERRLATAKSFSPLCGPEPLAEVARDAIALASRLQAELAGVRADAERYRWLRERTLGARGHGYEAVLHELLHGEEAPGLDAAVDAAIAATEARTLRTASTSEGR